MQANRPRDGRNILILYDLAARDACALIVGFQLELFLCGRKEIERRLHRSHGEATLFRETLRRMDEAVGQAREIAHITVTQNRRIRNRGGSRSTGPQYTFYPRDYARDIAFPGVVAADGGIFGSSHFDFIGQAIPVPDRPYRRGAISMSWADLIVLSAERGFEFHRHGLRAHWTLMRRMEQRVAGKIQPHG